MPSPLLPPDDSFQQLLAPAACRSPVRQFRRAATLTAGQLVTSIVRAVDEEGGQRDTAHRQLAVEEKKAAAAKGQAKVITAQRCMRCCSVALQASPAHCRRPQASALLSASPHPPAPTA